MTDVILKLDRLSKEYGQGSSALRILDELDLTVNRGDYTGIVGASGSGKTTLLNILGCLDRPTSGHYYLDGVDTSTLNDDQLSGIRMSFRSTWEAQPPKPV